MDIDKSSYYVGVLREHGVDGIVILDCRAPELGKEIIVKRRHLKGAPFGLKVVVEYLYRQKDNCYGKIIEVLGNPAEPDVATLAIVRRYGLAENFPPAVQQAAKAIPDELDPETIERELAEGRIDHREQQVITIDGLDAKDLDDAIYLETRDGLYHLWIHIADVSHYVRPGTALDTEAMQRGNSVYLPNLVLPMLPPQISNGIASLHPGVDRLTVTCRLRIEQDGKVTNGEVYPSLINSCARLSYEEVEPVLKDQAELQADRPEGLTTMLFAMRECALALRGKRKRRGALEFEFPETKIEIDDTGRPVEIRREEIGISNQIIEEFMIAANEYIAALTDKHQLPAIYRVHETPDPDKLQQFEHLSVLLGLNFRISPKPEPAEIAEILAELKGKTYEPTLSAVLLRAMAKAKYSVDNSGHFALAAKDYLHFTAPIRRYADLVTHRSLKMLGQRKTKVSRYRLIEIAKHISATERNAEAAERDNQTYLIALYLSDQIGTEYEGVISSISSSALYVQLDNTAEGAIMYRSLPDYYSYLEQELAACNERTGEIVRLGDKVRVKLVEVDLNLLQITFELLRHDSGTGVAGRKRDATVGKRRAKTAKPSAAGAAKRRKNRRTAETNGKKSSSRRVRQSKESGSGLTRSQRARIARRERQRAERQRIKDSLKKARY
ncbi:MAG: ribonuclease R family protein [Saccharofermentanales bacterium]|jgi:ribonuclease R